MVDSRDRMNSTRNVLPTSKIKLGGLYTVESVDTVDTMNPNYDTVLAVAIVMLNDLYRGSHLRYEDA